MRTILLIHILLSSFANSCQNELEKDSRGNDDTTQNLITKRMNQTEFEIDSFHFSKRNIDTLNLHIPKDIKLPKGYIQIIRKEEVSFDVNFEKTYFTFNKSIPNEVLNKNEFWHTIFLNIHKILNPDESEFSPFLDELKNRKFSFSNIVINYYGSCATGLLSTQWSNSNQDHCLIIINNSKHEISVWNYDDFKFDKQGNIFALFRLKDRRTWYYYNYDSVSNCFIPVATKYWKLYDN